MSHRFVADVRRLPLLCLALAFTCALPAQAQTTEEQAALALLSPELVAEEMAQYRALLAESDAKGRSGLVRLALAQPSADRGAFAIRLLDKPPEMRRAMVRMLGEMSAVDTVAFALDLAKRLPKDWGAIDGLLATMPPGDVARLILDGPWDAYCWKRPADIVQPNYVDEDGEEVASPEIPDQVIEGADTELPSGMRECTPEQARFINAWSKRPKKRVVVGARARAGDAPWQVQLLRAGKSAESFNNARQDALDRDKYGEKRDPWQRNHVCGGTLIPGGWVVTAAHCVSHDWDRNNAGFFDGRRVRTGALNIFSQGEIWAIDAVVMHKSYVSPKQGFDIALLKLAGSPESRFAVLPATPANLPEATRPTPAATTPLRLSGWGFTGKTSDTSAARNMDGDLQLPAAWLGMADLYVRPNAECNGNRNYTTRGYAMVAGQLCVGGKGGVDSCRGDSGGPLVDTARGRPVLLGIVSYGPGCGLERTPGIYVDVRAYRSWIEGAKRQAVRGRIVEW